MSLKPQPVGDIPEATARVARAAFCKPSAAMRLRDEFGVLYQDEDFAALFPTKGQPALAPWRLALVTVLQFMENLTDRQAADAVRGRLDWKYALGYELEDTGFDASVLSEFRTRLSVSGAEAVLLDRILEHFKAKGLVKARGKQRTDSTHVLALMRSLNLLELAGETMRMVLNDLAEAAPVWLRNVAPDDWYERYGHRVEAYRLPKSQEERAKLAVEIGKDGFYLLDILKGPTSPDALRHHPSVAILERMWEEQFERQEGQVKWRLGKSPAARDNPLKSPYEIEARFSQKGTTTWVGYKVCLTETCDKDTPHLITHVETTPAPFQDVSTTELIHEQLEQKRLLPEVHLVDTGFIDADLILDSAKDYGIELLGPMRLASNWQAKTPEAYDLSRFTIDWDNERVLCPEGKHSAVWSERREATGRPIIYARFRGADCQACPSRSLCTRAKSGKARCLLFQPRAQYEALKEAREQQTTPQWQGRYNARAGVEGLMSQGVRAHGMRRCRYRGLAKAAVQETATAAGINVLMVIAWFAGKRPEKTRTTHFQRLRMAA